MNRRLEFDTRESFLAELRRLLEEGTPRRDLRVRMPYLVPEAEELLVGRPGRLRFFTLAGGVGGFLGGLALAVGTSLHWPIITGGKPIVSWPPFLLIGYLMIILFGSLASFAGFLLLARLPSPPGLAEVEGERFSERFIIEIVRKEEPWKPSS